MILRKLVGRNWILLTVIVLLVGAVFIRLGFWQLDRLAERRAFNSQVKSIQAMATLSLPTKEDLSREEYRSITAVGTYDFQNQIAIRNQIQDGEYGYDLVTPLRLAPSSSLDTGPLAVLVDRGWIPAQGNATPADWRKYDLPGRVIVNGILRLSQVAPAFAGLTEPTPTAGQSHLDFWVYLDVERIGQQLPYGVLPEYLQLDPTPNSSNPPIAPQLVLDLSDGPHMGYAIQWFSFAVVMVGGYAAYVRKQETFKV